jgi:putrescine aminotransferase
MANSYWHPFSDLAANEKNGALVIDRGVGCYVWDEQGRRYFDATAGLWFCNVGHGRSELADVAAAQMRKIAAHSNFGDLGTRPSLELAERLAAIAPVASSKVFLTSGGSDSVDTALKLARRYWQLRGRPDKTVIVSRKHGYHGMHAGGTSLSGISPNREGWGPLLETTQVPWDAVDALANTIDAVGAGRVAAFFAEPVIGAGGLFPPPPGYLEGVEKVCREREVLFIVDEVITGYGRIGGDWFASTRFGLRPDILTGAKGVTSGYAPVGTVMVAPDVVEPFRSGGIGAFRHGYTYSGHAMSAAVAIANLDILEREGLLAHALRLEQTLHRELASLADRQLVGEIRSGTGALAAVQLDRVALAEDPALPQRLLLGLRQQGVLSRVLPTGALQISPSFVTTDDDVRDLAAAFSAALDGVLAA